MRQAIAAMFARHEAAINARLAGRIDHGSVFAAYGEAFLAATPSGVHRGDPDAAATVERYRDGGVRRMTIVNLRIEPIDLYHAVAFVDWSAERAIAGCEDTLDFASTYLMRVENGRATIFAAITGDEEAALTAPALAEAMG